MYTQGYRDICTSIQANNSKVRNFKTKKTEKARKRTSQTPHVERVVVVLQVNQQLRALEVARCHSHLSVVIVVIVVFHKVDGLDWVSQYMHARANYTLLITESLVANQRERSTRHIIYPLTK
jgi:nitrate reductase NapAB chaperone NapD